MLTLLPCSCPYHLGSSPAFMIWSFQHRCGSALAVLQWKRATCVVKTVIPFVMLRITATVHTRAHTHAHTGTHAYTCRHTYTRLVKFKQRGSNNWQVRCIDSVMFCTVRDVPNWYKVAAVGEDQTEDRTSWKTGSYNWQNCHTLSCQLFLDTGTIKNFKDSKTHEATLNKSW